MMDQALSPAFAPFTFALGLMLGVLLLELAAALMGLSLHGDTDLPTEISDLHASFDLDPDATPDIDHLLHTSDTLHTADLPGRAPLMIWAAAALFSFGLGGYTLQLMALTFGPTLSPWVAVPIALFGTYKFASGFAATFARLIPQNETTATTAQFMGGLRGVVTQGTARQGSPAEVRLRDRHGNLHHIRCEPFRDTDIIPEGQAVLTLRERLGPDRWGLRIIPVP